MDSFKIRHVRLVCPTAWNNLAPTGRIFMKFYIRLFFENVWRKFKNSGQFTCRRMYIYENVSLNSTYNVTCFRQEL
jgi:hypothetical protein